MSGLLQGKSVLVTGAASERGIGRAFSVLAARHGAIVHAIDIGFAPTDGFVPLEGVEGGSALACDITSEADCARLASLLEKEGGIDALVHCAGLAAPMSLAELDRAAYERMMDVNLWGTMLLARTLVPLMKGREGASITCLSSSAAQRGGGVVGGMHYAASKAGVLGFVKSLARELGPSGIRVNAVAPGMVDTDMTGPFMAREKRVEVARAIPLGRMAEPSEIAAVCLFLASDLASYITGATIDANGGLHIH